MAQIFSIHPQMIYSLKREISQRNGHPEGASSDHTSCFDCKFITCFYSFQYLLSLVLKGLFLFR